MFSCRSPFSGKAYEMGKKLKDQAGGDHDARKIRREPAWIVDDLQDRALFVRPVPIRLIKCFAGVTQRTVHVDQHLPVLARVGSLQPHAARKVLGDFRAGVPIKSEFDEVQAERLVESLRSQIQLKLATVVGEFLRVQKG